MPRVAWVLAAALALCGCYHPPAISGHHWHCSFIGCNLYDSDGVLVAAFIATGRITAARGCVYIGAGSNCVDFETNRLALGYIDRTMRKIDGDDLPPLPTMPVWPARATGPATTTGIDSPAITGSNNNVTIHRK